MSSSFPVPIIVPAPRSGNIGAPSWLRYYGDGLGPIVNGNTPGTTSFGGEFWYSFFQTVAGYIATGATNIPMIIRCSGPMIIGGTMAHSVNVTANGGIVTLVNSWGGGAGGGGGGGTAAGSATVAIGISGQTALAAGSAGAALGGNGGNGGGPLQAQYQRYFVNEMIPLVTQLSGVLPANSLGGQPGGAGGSGGPAGGRGGGLIILVAPSISLTGVIDVSGGPGANSTGNNIGASGGGGGGVVLMAAQSYPVFTGTINVSGGAGGSNAGFTGAGNGGRGGDGWFRQFVIQ